MAAQRRGPTSSPRSGIERRQIQSGLEKKIAAVVVSGRKPSAAKLRTVLKSRKPPRTTTAPGLSVRRNRSPNGSAKATTSRRWPR